MIFSRREREKIFRRCHNFVQLIQYPGRVEIRNFVLMIQIHVCVLRKIVHHLLNMKEKTTKNESEFIITTESNYYSQ